MKFNKKNAMAAITKMEIVRELLGHGGIYPIERLDSLNTFGTVIGDYTDYVINADREDLENGGWGVSHPMFYKYTLEHTTCTKNTTISANIANGSFKIERAEDAPGLRPADVRDAVMIFLGKYDPTSIEWKKASILAFPYLASKYGKAIFDLIGLDKEEAEYANAELENNHFSQEEENLFEFAEAVFNQGYDTSGYLKHQAKLVHYIPIKVFNWIANGCKGDEFSVSQEGDNYVVSKGVDKYLVVCNNAPKDLLANLKGALA